jgi:hypothetical protein
LHRELEKHALGSLVKLYQQLMAGLLSSKLVCREGSFFSLLKAKFSTTTIRKIKPLIVNMGAEEIYL